LPRGAQGGAAVNDDDLNNPNAPTADGAATEKPFHAPARDDRGLSVMENLVNLPALIPPRGCSIDKGEIVFHDTGYRIDLRECNTHAKLVGWIHHLLEKHWVTARLLINFIELASAAAGLPPPWSLVLPFDPTECPQGGTGPVMEPENGRR
jgi:hypothetical protein